MVFHITAATSTTTSNLSSSEKINTTSITTSAAEITPEVSMVAIPSPSWAEGHFTTTATAASISCTTATITSSTNPIITHDN